MWEFGLPEARRQYDEMVAKREPTVYAGEEKQSNDNDDPEECESDTLVTSALLRGFKNVIAFP